MQDRPVEFVFAAAEAELGNSGRVLLRNSGTEPVVRVMVEGERHELVKTLAEGIADTLRRAAAS